MRIRWTDPALEDFTRICERSGVEFGPARGRKTALEIHGAVSSLASFPALARRGRKPGTFELVLPSVPFMAVYRVRGDNIEVLRVLHGAQKWP